MFVAGIIFNLVLTDCNDFDEEKRKQKKFNYKFVHNCEIIIIIRKLCDNTVSRRAYRMNAYYNIILYISGVAKRTTYRYHLKVDIWRFVGACIFIL